MINGSRARDKVQDFMVLMNRVDTTDTSGVRRFRMTDLLSTLDQRLDGRGSPSRARISLKPGEIVKIERPAQRPGRPLFYQLEGFNKTGPFTSLLKPEAFLVSAAPDAKRGAKDVITVMAHDVNIGGIFASTKLGTLELVVR